jgi:hypothetical protein
MFIKKAISMLIALSLLVSISVVSVNGISREYNGFYFEVDPSSNNAIIVDYIGTEEDIIIPGSIYGYTVTSIDEYAFFNNSVIKSVVFPNTIINIAYKAFSQCSALKKVVLPNSLKELDDSVFYKCPLLSEVYFNSSLTEIPANTFNGCYSLKTVSLSKGIERISDGAFANCTGLEALTIPKTVNYISDTAFANSQSLSIKGYTDVVKNYCNTHNINFTLICQLYGDANNDGRVNITDATYIQKAVVQMEGFAIAKDTEAYIAADVDCNGSISIVDATIIQKYINHILSELPYTKN